VHPAEPPPHRVDRPDLLAEAAQTLQTFDSSHSNSDLGIDRDAPHVLEVIELWAGAVMNVRHFGRDRSQVRVGDPSFARFRPLSTALTALLLVGVGFFCVRHGTLPEPPRYVGDDEALIGQWEEAIEGERFAAATEAARQRRAERASLQDEADERGVTVDAIEAERAAAEPPRPDPLATARKGWEEARQAEFEALKAEHPERPDRWLGGAPFQADYLPGLEGLIRDELLPVAREDAAQGRLRRSWIDLFEGFQPASGVADGEVETLEAQLFAWGSEVLHEEQIFVVIPASGPEHVHLLGADDERVDVDPAALLTDRAPTPDERGERHALYRELQELLYQDATERRAAGQQCRALSKLVELPGAEASLERQARQARCLHLRGKDEQVGPHVLAGLALIPSRPADEAEATDIAHLLQVHAERLQDVAIEDPERGDDALEAWGQLRGFVIDEVQDPGLLAVADHGIRQLETAKLATRQRRLVRGALNMALAIGLLLPIGLLVDERRSRRGAPDFDVPAWNLPTDPFPLVEREHGELLVGYGRDQVGLLRDVDGVERDLSEVPAEDVGGWLRAPLADDALFMLQLGERVFAIRSVHPAKLAPASALDRVDWRWLGTLAAVLLLAGGLAVLSKIAPVGPGTEVMLQPTSQTVALAAPVVLEPELDLAGDGPGDRAEGDEGAASGVEPDTAVPVISIARRKLDRDQEMVNEVLSDIFAPESFAEMAEGPLGTDIIAAATGMRGPNVGWHFGPGGGRGVRGKGPGGGGDSRLSGITIGDIVGDGPPGRRRLAQTTRKPSSTGPNVDTSGAIVINAANKAAIDRVVKSHLAQLRYCYQRELTRDVDLGGKVVIKFVIGKDGAVSQSSVKSSTLGNPSTERCLVEKFGRMRFVKPKGGGIVVVSYPMVFSSAG
jgi:hypothetical protein